MLVGDWGQLIRGYLRGLEKCTIEVCKREINGLGCVSGLGFFVVDDNRVLLSKRLIFNG